MLAQLNNTISKNRFIHSVMVLTLSVALAGLTLTGCDSNNNNSSSSKAQMQVKLHDAPALFGSVKLDIKKVEVKNTTTNSGWVTLSDNPTTVNLLDLTNGNAKVIASSKIASGNYTQLRLILGTDNQVEVNGTMTNLKLSSDAQSGVVVNINTQIDAQNNATILLDFDAARSIESDLSGSFTLNPVITATQQSESGQISGQIQPSNLSTVIYAMSGSDTVSTTYSDSTSGDFKFIGMAKGNYNLMVHSMNTAYSDTTISDVSVTAQQETNVGAVIMPAAQ